MPILKWSDVYSVNIQACDAEHQKLVDLINQLFDAMKAGKGSQELGEILQKMVDYADLHFANEEKLLSAYQYPQLARQKAQHEAFIQQVFEFSRDFQEGKVALSIKISNFLKNWLITHIQNEDKQYGPYLNSKGVH
jgi:hemerythrin